MTAREDDIVRGWRGQTVAAEMIFAAGCGPGSGTAAGSFGRAGRCRRGSRRRWRRRRRRAGLGVQFEDCRGVAAGVGSSERLSTRSILQLRAGNAALTKPGTPEFVSTAK